MTALRRFGLVLLLLCAPLLATHIHRRSLAEVAPEAPSILVARVDQIELGNPIVYQVQPQRTLKGPPSDEALTLRYWYPKLDFVERDGTRVRRSPIVDSSGQEASPRPGESWIFLYGPGGSVHRVEPITSETPIVDILHPPGTR